ncbi:lipopolysaccharide kinase InaA family protein [Marinospirillum perlucidum]|uniref:lipopolysaccharide kinase InaA family protein n=1 Tax=Marinospirillum perlucidum TaxID=1982602 RepID=UPI000DF4BE04|nr:lipopolysaccharide kinase InaA family protein [Marinospirillum perlucidum]
MAGLQIETCSNQADQQPLIDFGARLLAHPEDPEQLASDTPGPQITKSLNKVLRAGHQLHFVSYQGQEYIFKVFADLGQHGLGRRLDFFIKSWLQNPAQRSYHGALRLQQLEIPAIQPIACLNGRFGLHRRGLFIYKSVAAQQSLKTWLEGSPTPEVTEASLEQLACITRALEASSYHFADLKMSNILVEENSEGFRLVLIDTDDVILSHSKHWPWLPAKLQKAIKLWNLRRLKPNHELSLRFMAKHWPEEDTESAVNSWYTLRNIQANPLKWMKRKLRKRHAKKS